MAFPGFLGCCRGSCRKDTSPHCLHRAPLLSAKCLVSLMPEVPAKAPVPRPHLRMDTAVGSRNQGQAKEHSSKPLHPGSWAFAAVSPQPGAGGTGRRDADAWAEGAGVTEASVTPPA